MSEKEITLPPYATGMDEKDPQLMSQDADTEVGEGTFEEKGQLKQGLHQRHIQMIVSCCMVNFLPKTRVLIRYRRWQALLAPDSSWD